MTHTYTITGMTCNGCRASVEEALTKVEGVSSVQVDLNASKATIEMEEHIDTNIFRKALSAKYEITEKAEDEEKNMFANANSSKENVENKTKIQQLQPLLLIFLYISTTAILLHYKNWNTADFMLDFMGIFFIVFSFFKMLDLKGFPESFKMYDPLARVVPAYAWAYPFVETVLGLMFLMRFKVEIALIATIVILGITTVGVTKSLLDKKAIKCACLGTALKLPMTEATFIENAVMLLMSGFMIYKTYAL